MNVIMKYLFPIASLLILFLSSCSTDDKNAHNALYEENITAITVASISRADDNPDIEPDSVGDLTVENKLGEGSILYISQMGTTTNPDFSKTSFGPDENLFKYEWYSNPAANWEEEYNFAAMKETKPMTWTGIRRMGQVGNAFSLYAMYFPKDNAPKFSAAGDQTNLDSLLVSDIMGAYHSTSALYTRLRFRLFHLMSYLRVTLYVPTLEKSDDDNSYSGFGPDAFQSAIVMNAYTTFDIEWRANRTSDIDAPLIDPTRLGNRRDISMYRHPLQQEDDVIEINVRDFYSNGDIDTDSVRVYNFSVLFPPQEFNGNILQFKFKTPGETTRNYYFAASQLISGSNDFRFDQGTLQHLTLYLPRTGNTTILVKAVVNSWNSADTDMTVTEEENLTSTGDDENQNNG